MARFPVLGRGGCGVIASCLFYAPALWLLYVWLYRACYVPAVWLLCAFLHRVRCC